MILTLTVKDLLISLIFIGLIVFLCYLIVLVRNLIKTIKSTNKILDDACVVSEIAAKKATELDGVIDDVSSTVSELSDLIKGNQSIVAALSNIVNAVGSMTTIFRKGKEKAK